jgi:energy-converting hydrogenase A subunit M
MKEDLIIQIKELLKINENDVIDINPNYLEYFQEEELEDMINQLNGRKKNVSSITAEYLDEIYEKTKKDEI